MSEALSVDGMAPEQDQRISEVVDLERARLRNFIRRRVSDERDVEDILQEVFYELVEAYRTMKPIERVSAWLYRVARNRITDLPARIEQRLGLRADFGSGQEGDRACGDTKDRGGGSKNTHCHTLYCYTRSQRAEHLVRRRDEYRRKPRLFG